MSTRLQNRDVHRPPARPCPSGQRGVPWLVRGPLSSSWPLTWLPSVTHADRTHFPLPCWLLPSTHPAATSGPSSALPDLPLPGSSSRRSPLRSIFAFPRGSQTTLRGIEVHTPSCTSRPAPRFPPKRSSRPAVKSPHASGRRTLRAHSSLSPTHRKSRGACVFFPRPFTQALLTRAVQVASPTYCHIFGSTRAGKIVNPSGVRDWHAGAFLILNETRFQPQVFNQILTTFPVVRSFPSVLNPLQSKSFWGSTRSRIVSAHRQNLSQPSRTAIKLSEHERAWPLRKSYLKHSPRNKKPPNFARETYNFCPQAIQTCAILLQPRAGLSSGGPS